MKIGKGLLKQADLLAGPLIDLSRAQRFDDGRDFVGGIIRPRRRGSDPDRSPALDCKPLVCWRYQSRAHYTPTVTRIAMPVNMRKWGRAIRNPSCISAPLTDLRKRGCAYSGGWNTTYKCITTHHTDRVQDPARLFSGFSCFPNAARCFAECSPTDLSVRCPTKSRPVCW